MIDLEQPPTCQACIEEMRLRAGPQKALVAFGYRNSAIVLEATPGLSDDMHEAGIDAGDVWTANKNGAPSEGMLGVWEGRIVYTTTPSSPNGLAEFDEDYIGQWRQLSADEWRVLIEGATLWPVPELPEHTCSIATLIGERRLEGGDE